MRNYLLLVILVFSSISYSEETISVWVRDYFERIHKSINEENYDKALKELQTANERYFRGGRTYEAALLYQLYGQFYALQNKYTEALPWFEKSLATEKLPRIGAQEVRFQLAQTYFMVGKYQNVIPLLNDYIDIGMKYSYPIS